MKKQNISGHLRDLRGCLLSISIFIVLGSVCGYLISKELIKFFMKPMGNVLHNNNMLDSHRMIYTGMAEAFLVHIKIAIFFGTIITSPLWLFKLWGFVAPGLYKNERKSFLSLFIISPILFISGCSFAYYLVLPKAYSFFLSFEIPATANSMALHMEMRLMEFLSFMMRLVIAFGLTFQMPVILKIANKMGWITSNTLKKNWRFVIVGIFSLSAIITPPDVFSMISLAVPLILLYAISILFIMK